MRLPLLATTMISLRVISTYAALAGRLILAMADDDAAPCVLMNYMNVSARRSTIAARHDDSQPSMTPTACRAAGGGRRLRCQSFMCTWLRRLCRL